MQCTAVWGEMLRCVGVDVDVDVDEGEEEKSVRRQRRQGVEERRG